MTRQDDNIRKRIKSTERFVPFTPSATSYGMGWKTLQAVRYRESPARGELSLPPVSRHRLVLTIRPAERLEVRYEGVRLDRPPAAGSINVIPAGSSVLWRREGSMDALFVNLEPSLVARVAARADGRGVQTEVGGPLLRKLDDAVNEQTGKRLETLMRVLGMRVPD